MENEPLRINLLEGFSCLIQKDCLKKYIGVIGLLLIPVFSFALSFATFYFSKGETLLIILGVALALISFILLCLAMVEIFGYFLLYARDRANDENALFREWSRQTWKLSFVSGCKVVLMGLIKWPFTFLMFPLSITAFVAIAMFNISNYYLFTTISALPNLIFELTFGAMFVKIFAYFVTDLSLEKFLQWGTAFNFTKGNLRDCLLAAFIPAFLIVVLNNINVCIFVNLSNKTNINPAYGFLTAVALSIIIIIVAKIVYFNYLGQYSYVSGKMNGERIEAEKRAEEERRQAYIEQVRKEMAEKGVNEVPASVKQESNSTKVILIVILILLLCPVILAIAGVVAALTIPSIVNRQSDLSAKVKVKKSIAIYEDVTAVYLAENAAAKESKPATLRGLTGANCEKLGNYFKIIAEDKENNCNFTTADGVRWSFDPTDGSATVSDSEFSPKVTVRMGMCSNGQINCKEEFPEVWRLMSNP